MSFFADGGVMGSKPYAASGAYIDRMSRYCGGCGYDVRARTTEDACPFNSLYWEFLARNRERLAGNHRMGYMYQTLDKMTQGERGAIEAKAAALKQEFGAEVVGDAGPKSYST